MGKVYLTRHRCLLAFCLLADIALVSLIFPVLSSHFPRSVLSFVLIPFFLGLTVFLLWLRVFLTRVFWIKLWLCAAPWVLSSLFLLPHISLFPRFPLLLLVWIILGGWGYVHFYPLYLMDFRLHRARFARIDEQRELLSHTPLSESLLLGTTKYFRQFVAVRATKKRRELGNLLIVAPTRLGKGLLAISQLLSWKHSVIVNDIKGELYDATAGYRSTLGEVYVIDPAGYGHCYDPLQGKSTEDQLFAAASNMLYDAAERDPIFTQRATVMLTQLLAAAKKEGIPALPYVSSLTRLGLVEVAERLNTLDPTLATQFLDVSFVKVDFSDKFLHSAWSTLTTKLRPLLTETLVRCFTHADFTAERLMRSEKPLTVYFRWKEEDLLHLSPLVRLLWGSLMNELITTYDTNQGKGCHPVLLLVDEAGRTAIPALADQATTVVGRHISLTIYIQSLSQLEVEYGRARAQVIRDNMETQIYYRPNDLSTAQYLEERCGNKSGYAKSTTSREGEIQSEGRAERPIPLITAQDIAYLKDEEIIGFHRRLHPFKMRRLEWWNHTTLKQRRNIPAPTLPTLPPVSEMLASLVHRQTSSTSQRFADPDALLKIN